MLLPASFSSLEYSVVSLRRQLLITVLLKPQWDEDIFLATTQSLGHHQFETSLRKLLAKQWSGQSGLVS